MFDNHFVDTIRQLLQAEQSPVMCMLELDADPNKSGSILYVERDDPDLDYLRFLRGNRIGEGWIDDVGRFGCISDSGGWCIYCERRNEMAVLAVKNSTMLELCGAAITEFHAMALPEAFALSLSSGFSHRVFPAWKNQLLDQYRDKII